MSKILFLIALCLVSAMAFDIRSENQDDDKVKIDFYYESLCPYCSQFMKKSLSVAMKTPDFWKICDFTLYPYGNAKRTKNGTSWQFQCQHGPRECQGNVLENCAIRLNEDSFYDKVLPWIICLERGSIEWHITGAFCSRQHGLDWNAIHTCAKGDQGNKFTADVAEATEKLDPPHRYVPWLVINDKHEGSSESAVRSDMVKFVCTTYSGPEKIAACDKYHQK